MDVDERCLGVEPTPEIRALVRTVFERALGGAGDRVDRVMVRLAPEGSGVACRASLRLLSGKPVVSAETRPSIVDAVLATASHLSRALSAEEGVRARRHRRRGGRRGRTSS
jgi:hypothetical protein